MSTTAAKVDVTAADILSVFKLPPEDRPAMAASDPLSREELLVRAGAEASKRRSGVTPAPPWRHANKARASLVIDKLVEEGRLISGDAMTFGVYARAHTLYCTPEVARWHRQQQYDGLVRVSLKKAREKASVDLIEAHRDEYTGLVDKHYEEPEYRVDIFQPETVSA